MSRVHVTWSDALEVLGACCLVAAAAVLHLALAFAVAGVALILLANTGGTDR